MPRDSLTGLSPQAEESEQGTPEGRRTRYCNAHTERRQQRPSALHLRGHGIQYCEFQSVFVRMNRTRDCLFVNQTYDLPSADKVGDSFVVTVETVRLE